MEAVQVTVLGVPAPQGSKRAFVAAGRARIVEQSKRTGPWRDSVSAAAANAMNGSMPIDAAIAIRRGVAPNDVGLDVAIKFRFVKPTSAKRRQYPSVAPDIDKLCRAILDGLTAAGVYTDDARVVGLTAVKVYADSPGADISVREAKFA